MNIEDIRETDIWTLYDKNISYCRLINMYSDTDLNYRMFNGNQWEGLKIKGIEPVQYNFIKPIVKYKVGTINSNLWGINYSSDNFENQSFRPLAERTCELLNKRAGRIWEKDNLDKKIRDVSKDSAINDEGIMYVFYDEDKELPSNEVLDKNDIYYGNENCMEIERQPYILVKQRKAVSEVIEYAKKNGVSEKELEHIVGDQQNLEEAGEQAKQEINDMVTLVTKLYKKEGKVHFAQATRYVDIKKDTNTGYSYYPVAHFLWEEKKGSARGEGEVRHLIPNQLETNKTAMRRLITVKNTAYPQKVANVDKIQNPSALNEVGGVIRIKGGLSVDDVAKIFTNINPAQMSPDVEKLQQELIQSTRELAGAGDIATGEVDPESASGRAILAVQQASQQPLVEQLGGLKAFIEDLARIWLDITTVHSKDGLQLEEEVTDPTTGEKTIQVVKVDQVTLEELKASVKVDVTPKGAFDKFAQESSMENLLKGGYFSPEMIGQLKVYVKTLDDDSVMPKQKLERIIEEYEAEQERINMMNAQAQIMQQKAMQFLSGDPEMQAQQMYDATQQPTDQPMEEEMPTDTEGAPVGEEEVSVVEDTEEQ